MRDKLIEWDLPLAEISEQSAREKYLSHGHPSTLHIWWARRPLAASRATAFAALMDDPGNDEERRELLELIEDITPWEAVKDGNSPAIEEARRRVLEQFDGEPPKVLDPFAGGGSIPLEALRLGCETYASDYNPVAVFIEKATLEWPQKFGVEVELPEEETEQLSGLGGGEKVNLLAYLVGKWANKVLEEAREEIGQFYPTEDGSGLVGKREITEHKGWTPVGYLWARTIPCQNPRCGAEIPLIRQYWLAKKKNKRIAYRPVVDHEAKTVDFEILKGKELERAEEKGFDPKDATVYRANAECLVCGQVTKAEQVRQLARDGEMDERMVAVALHHPDEVGKKYRLATDEDFDVYEAAGTYLHEQLKNWPDLQTPIPQEELPPIGTLGFRVNRYGMRNWAELFNSRQQLALVSFTKLLRGTYASIEAQCHTLVSQADTWGTRIRPEELARATIGYLALAVDRLAENCAKLCRWNANAEKMQGVFGRQALPMTWDFFECNPFGGSVGDWLSLADLQVNGIQENLALHGSGKAQRASATQLPWPDHYFDAVFTDPPYYDNVPYAALSDFFYVWLKRAVGEHFPDLFSTPLVPKSDEAIMEPARHATSGQAKDFFERMLHTSLSEVHRVLRPGGITVVVYAHKTTEGWETVLKALVEAGFVVTGSWPVHTESKTRLRAAQSAALASSIYMVCRKGQRETLGFWEDIRPRVKERAEERLEHFWNQGLIRGGDFFISAIGPGMEAYSEYEEVRTYDDREFKVLDLLQYIRGVATDFLVHRLLKDASAEAIDKEAQFYLTYRWTFADNKVEFDDALRIAKAEGVDLESLWGDGGFVKKTTKYIRVHGPQDRDVVSEVDNMVDAMHRACQLWSKERHDELKRFLGQGYGSRSAFWQFCQAVAECHLDGDSREKKWLEGLLMAEGRYRGGGETSAGAPQTEMELE